VHSFFSQATINMSGSDMRLLAQTAAGWLRFLQVRQLAQQVANVPRHLALLPQRSTLSNTAWTRAGNALVRWAVRRRCEVFRQCAADSLGSAYLPLFMKRLLCTRSLYKRLKQLRKSQSTTPMAEFLVGLEPLAKIRQVPLGLLAAMSHSPFGCAADTGNEAAGDVTPEASNNSGETWWLYAPHAGTASLQAALAARLGDDSSGNSAAASPQDSWHHILSVCTYLAEGLTDHERCVLLWLESHPLVDMGTIGEWRAKAAAILHHVHVVRGVPSDPTSAVPSVSNVVHSVATTVAHARGQAAELDGDEEESLHGATDQPGFAAFMNLLVPNFAELAFRAEEISALEHMKVDASKLAAGCAFKMFKSSSQNGRGSSEIHWEESTKALALPRGGKESGLFGVPGFQTRDVARRTGVHGVRELLWYSATWKKDATSCGLPAIDAEDTAAKVATEQLVTTLLLVADRAFAAGSADVPSASPRGLHRFDGARGIVKAVESAVTKTSSDWLPDSDAQARHLFEEASKPDVATARVQVLVSCSAAVVHLRHSLPERWDENIPESEPHANLILSPRAPARSSRWSSLASHGPLDQPAAAAAGSRTGTVIKLEGGLESSSVLPIMAGDALCDARPVYASVIFMDICTDLKIHESLQHWLFESSASELLIVCPHGQKKSLQSNSDYASGFRQLLAVSSLGETNGLPEAAQGRALFSQLHVQSRASVSPRQVFVQDCGPSLWFMHHFSHMRSRDARMTVHSGQVDCRFCSVPVAACIFELQYLHDLNLMWLLSHGTAQSIRAVNMLESRMKPVPNSGFVEMYNTARRTGVAGAHPEQLVSLVDGGAFFSSSSPTAKLSFLCSGVSLLLHAEVAEVREPSGSTAATDTCQTMLCRIEDIGLHLSSFRSKKSVPDAGTLQTLSQVTEYWAKASDDVLGECCIRLSNVQVSPAVKVSSDKLSSGAPLADNKIFGGLSMLTSSKIKVDLYLHSRPNSDPLLAVLEKFTTGSCQSRGSDQAISDSRTTLLSCAAFVDELRARADLAQLGALVDLCTGVAERIVTTIAAPLIAREVKAVADDTAGNLADLVIDAPRRVNSKVVEVLEMMPQYMCFKLFVNSAIGELQFGDESPVRFTSTTEKVTADSVFSLPGSCSAVSVPQAAVSMAKPSPGGRTPNDLSFVFESAFAVYIHCIPRLFFTPWRQISSGLHQLNRDRAGAANSFSLGALTVAAHVKDVCAYLKRGQGDQPHHVEQMIAPFSTIAGIQLVHSSKADANSAPLLPRPLSLPLKKSPGNPEFFHMIQEAIEAKCDTSLSCLDAIAGVTRGGHRAAGDLYFGTCALAQFNVGSVHIHASPRVFARFTEMLARVIMSLVSFVQGVGVVVVKRTTSIQQLVRSMLKVSAPADQAVTESFIDMWRSAAFAVDSHIESITGVLLSDNVYGETAKQLLQVCLTNVSLLAEYGTHAPRKLIPVMRTGSTLQVLVLAETDPRWVEVIAPFAVTSKTSYSIETDNAVSGLVLTTSVATLSDIQMTLSPGVVSKFVEAAHGINGLIATLSGLLATAQRTMHPKAQDVDSEANDAKPFEPFYMVNALGYDLSYEHDHPQLRSNSLLLEAHLGLSPEQQPVALSLQEAVRESDEESKDVGIQNVEISSNALKSELDGLQPHWARLSMGDDMGERADQRYAIIGQRQQQAAASIVQQDPCLTLRLDGCSPLRGANISQYDNRLRFVRVLPAGAGMLGESDKLPFLWQVQRSGTSKLACAASLVRFHNHLHGDVQVIIERDGTSVPLSCSVEQLTMIPLPFFLASCNFNLRVSGTGGAALCSPVQVAATSELDAFSSFSRSVESSDGPQLLKFWVQATPIYTGTYLINIHVCPALSLVNYFSKALVVQWRNKALPANVHTATIEPQAVITLQNCVLLPDRDDNSSSEPHIEPMEVRFASVPERGERNWSLWSPLAAGDTNQGNVSQDFIQMWGQCSETVTCEATQRMSMLTGKHHQVSTVPKMSHLHLKQWKRLPASIDDVPLCAAGTLLSISAPFALHNSTEDAIALQSVWPDTSRDIAAVLGVDPAAASCQVALNWMAELSLATAVLLPPGSIAAGLSFEAQHDPAQVPHLSVERSGWNGMFAGDPDALVRRWVALNSLASGVRLRTVDPNKQRGFLSNWSLSSDDCSQLSKSALGAAQLPSVPNFVNLDCNEPQFVRLPAAHTSGCYDYILHPLIVEQETSLATIQRACTVSWVLSPQFVLRNSSEFTLVVTQVCMPHHWPEVDVNTAMENNLAVIFEPDSSHSWQWRDTEQPPFVSVAFVRAAVQSGGAAAEQSSVLPEILSDWSTPVSLHDFRDSSCLIRPAGGSQQRASVSVRASHISTSCSTTSGRMTKTAVSSAHDIAVAALSETNGMTRQFAFSLDRVPTSWKATKQQDSAPSYTTCLVHNDTRETYIMRPLVHSESFTSASSSPMVPRQGGAAPSLGALPLPPGWLQQALQGISVPSLSSELTFLIPPGQQRVVVPTGIGEQRGLFALSPVTQPSTVLVNIDDVHDLALVHLASSRNQAGLSFVGGSAAASGSIAEFAPVTLGCSDGFLGLTAQRQEAISVPLKSSNGLSCVPDLPSTGAPQLVAASKMTASTQQLIAPTDMLPLPARLAKRAASEPPALHSLHMQPLFFVKLHDADHLALDLHSVAMEIVDDSGRAGITFGSKVLVCCKALISPASTGSKLCELDEQVFALRCCRSGACSWEPLPSLLAQVLDPQLAPETSKVSATELKVASKCVFIVAGGPVGEALQADGVGTAAGAGAAQCLLMSAYYSRRLLHFGGGAASPHSVMCCELQPVAADDTSGAASPAQTAPGGVFSGWTSHSWDRPAPPAPSPVVDDADVSLGALPGGRWCIHQGSILSVRKLDSVLPPLNQRVHLLRTGMDGSSHTLTIRALDIQQATHPDLSSSAVVSVPRGDTGASAVSIELGIILPSVTVSLHSPSAAELARAHLRGISISSSLAVPSLLQLLPMEWLLNSLHMWSGAFADAARKELKAALRSHSEQGSAMFAPSQRWLQAVLAAVRPMLMSICKQLPRKSRARLLEACNLSHGDGDRSETATALSVINSVLQPSPFSKTALAIVRGDVCVGDIRVDDPREDSYYATVLQWVHAADSDGGNVVRAAVVAHYSPAALKSTTSISMDQNVLHLPRVQLDVQPLKLQVSTAFVQALSSQFIVPSVLAAPTSLSGSMSVHPSSERSPFLAVGLWWGELEQKKQGSGWGLVEALQRRLHVDALRISGIQVSVSVHASTHHTRTFLLEGERALTDLGLVIGSTQSSASTSWSNTSFLRNKQTEQGLAISLLRSLQTALSSLGIALVPVAATLGALVATVSSVSDSVLPLRPLQTGGFMTAKSIAQQMATHLTSELIWSLHNILLNIDILGKPVVVVRRLSQGTLDLITRPAAGLRALSLIDTLKGLGSGSASFAGGVFSGVGTAAQAISTSLGRGAAALTFDDEFLKRRVADSRRKGFEVSKFSMWSRQVHLASMNFAIVDADGVYIDAKAARVWTMLQLVWASRHVTRTRTPAYSSVKESTAGASTLGSNAPPIAAAAAAAEGGSAAGESDSPMELPGGFEYDAVPDSGDDGDAALIKNLLVHSALQQYAVLTVGVAPLDGPAFASLARFLSTSPSYRDASLLAVHTITGMHDLIQRNWDESVLQMPNTKRVAGVGNPSTSSVPLFAGIAHGALELSSGLVHGVTGLVTQPVRGFMKDNSAGGLLGGVLRGVAGVVARPTVGALDAVSRVGEGIAAMGDSTWLQAARAKLSNSPAAELSSETNAALSSTATASSQAGALQLAMQWWRGTQLGSKHLSPSAAHNAGAAWSALYTVEQHALSGAAEQGFALYGHAMWLWIREQHPQKLRWGFRPPSLLPLRSEHALIMWGMKLRTAGVPCGVPVSVGHTVWKRLLPAIKASAMALSDISKSTRDFKVLRSRRVRVVRMPEAAAKAAVEALAGGQAGGQLPTKATPVQGTEVETGETSKRAEEAVSSSQTRRNSTAAHEHLKRRRPHQVQTDAAIAAAAIKLHMKAVSVQGTKVTASGASKGAQEAAFSSHTRRNSTAAREYLKRWKRSPGDSEYYFEGEHTRHLIVPDLASFVADPYLLVKRLTQPGSQVTPTPHSAAGTAEECGTHGGQSGQSSKAQGYLPHVFVFIATEFEVSLVEYGALGTLLASRACSISESTAHDLDMPVMQLCWKLPFEGPQAAFDCLATIGHAFEQSATTFAQSLGSAPAPRPAALFPSPAGSLAPASLAGATASQTPSQRVAYFDALVQQSLGAMCPLLDAPPPLEVALGGGGAAADEAQAPATAATTLARRFFQHTGPTQDALSCASPFSKAITMLRCLSISLHPADNGILLQGAMTEMTEALSAEVNRGAGKHITLDADDIMPSFGVLLVRACPRSPLLVAALLGALANRPGQARSVLQTALDTQLGERSLHPVLDANQVEYSANMLASFSAVAARMGGDLLATGEYPALCWPLQEQGGQRADEEAVGTP